MLTRDLGGFHLIRPVGGAAPAEAGGHHFYLVSSHGEDAPNKSLDLYYHCERCGTIKHDYRHNGGQTSPNFPLFLVVGHFGWRAITPPCQLPER